MMVSIKQGTKGTGARTGADGAVCMHLPKAHQGPACGRFRNTR